MQELIKGNNGTVVGNINNGLFGGWGFNFNHIIFTESGLIYLTPDEVAALPLEVLQTEPVFQRFGVREEEKRFEYFPEKLMAEDEDIEAGIEASKMTTLYTVLGESIPARSFGAASDRVLAFGGDDEKVFNMDTMKNGWPESTGMFDIRNRWSGQWLHSDFRDVALVYTVNFWDEIIAIGTLNEDQ